MNQDNEVLDYLSKQETRQAAFNLSLQFYQISKNWFTAKQIAKKVKGESEQDIYIKLLALQTLGMSQKKIDDKGVEKFKIILQDKDKIHYLEQRVHDLEQEKQFTLLEIEKLKKQIK